MVYVVWGGGARLQVLSFGDNTCSLHFWDWLWGCRLSDLLARGTLPTAVTGSSSVSQCLTVHVDSTQELSNLKLVASITIMAAVVRVVVQLP